jgi:hypothetical protein
MCLIPVKYNYFDFPKNTNSKVENVSLKNMIEPTFVNFGTNTVFIDGRELLTGESIVIGASGCIVQDSDVEIQFRTTNDVARGETNQVRLFYNTPIQQ